MKPIPHSRWEGNVLGNLISSCDLGHCVSSETSSGGTMQKVSGGGEKDRVTREVYLGHSERIGSQNLNG